MKGGGGGGGAGGGHHRHRLGLRALSFHGLVLAAGGRGGGLQRGLSFHLGLQVEVVVGHIRHSGISRVTIGCKLFI